MKKLRKTTTVLTLGLITVLLTGVCGVINEVFAASKDSQAIPSTVVEPQTLHHHVLVDPATGVRITFDSAKYPVDTVDVKSNPLDAPTADEEKQEIFEVLHDEDNVALFAEDITLVKEEKELDSGEVVVGEYQLDFPMPKNFEGQKVILRHLPQGLTGAQFDGADDSVGDAVAKGIIFDDTPYDEYYITVKNGFASIKTKSLSPFVVEVPKALGEQAAVDSGGSPAIINQGNEEDSAKAAKDKDSSLTAAADSPSDEIYRKQAQTSSADTGEQSFATDFWTVTTLIFALAGLVIALAGKKAKLKL